MIIRLAAGLFCPVIMLDVFTCADEKTGGPGVGTSVQDDKDTKYRDFLDDLPEIVFELDPTGILTYVNRRVESVLGYSKEDLLGKNALVLITPETRQALRDTISDYLYMTYWFGEVELLSSDGSKTFPSRVSASPVIRDDELVAIRGVILDISMRKNLEEKLRRSEERFRRLSDTALEAILFHEEGKIQDCNSAFTELLTLCSPGRR